MIKSSMLLMMMWFASCADAPRQATAPSTAPASVTAPASTPDAAAPDAGETQAAPEQQPPKPDAQANPDAAAKHADAEIDALLTKLESAAKDLTSFVANIDYEKEDAILGRSELRMGEIIYRIGSAPPDEASKSFAVLFHSRIVGNRRDNRAYHYVFDGRWLAEIDHENKQFIKREIVEPGKVLDPLKLGEGPFPLPIGQSKDEVLARFEVARIDVPAEGLLKPLQNVDGLELTPREGTPEARDYQKVQIFYDRQTLLPVGINAIEVNDDRKTVRLTNLQRNPELTDDMKRKLDIADPDPRQWKIDIRPWRQG